MPAVIYKQINTFQQKKKKQKEKVTSSSYFLFQVTGQI